MRSPQTEKENKKKKKKKKKQKQKQKQRVQQESYAKPGCAQGPLFPPRARGALESISPGERRIARRRTVQELRLVLPSLEEGDEEPFDSDEEPLHGPLPICQCFNRPTQFPKRGSRADGDQPPMTQEWPCNAWNPESPPKAKQKRLNVPNPEPQPLRLTPRINISKSFGPRP